MCAALALTAGVAAAQGTLADRKTYVTFSGPVSLPGMTLPAGTYTFKIADSQADRHIVQVFSKDETKIFTTLLAVPAQRNEASGDPVITFKETPSDQPPAVHYWYYAGEKDGNELVYPKAQAMTIAKASGEPVMAVDCPGASMDDCKTGNISRVTADTPSSTASADQQPQQAPAQQPTTQPQQPMTPAPQPATPQPTTPEQTTTPQQPTTPSVPPPSASDTQRPVGTSGSLPKTASELPLVALIGFLAVGAAIGIRVARTA
jgi:hypothetical protein